MYEVLEVLGGHGGFLTGVEPDVCPEAPFGGVAGNGYYGCEGYACRIGIGGKAPPCRVGGEHVAEPVACMVTACVKDGLVRPSKQFAYETEVVSEGSRSDVWQTAFVSIQYIHYPPVQWYVDLLACLLLYEPDEGLAVEALEHAFVDPTVV